jgi:hypothetical protein
LKNNLYSVKVSHRCKARFLNSAIGDVSGRHYCRSMCSETPETNGRGPPKNMAFPRCHAEPSQTQGDFLLMVRISIGWLDVPYPSR